MHHEQRKLKHRISLQVNQSKVPKTRALKVSRNFTDYEKTALDYSTATNTNH